MPWNGSCWYPFDADAILIAAPAVAGVFALRRGQAWLCIGETENLQDALLEQVDRTRLRVPLDGPTLFGYEAVPGKRGSAGTGS